MKVKNRIERNQIYKDSVQDQDIYLGDLYIYMVKVSKHHHSWFSQHSQWCLKSPQLISSWMCPGGWVGGPQPSRGGALRWHCSGTAVGHQLSLTKNNWLRTCEEEWELQLSLLQGAKQIHPSPQGWWLADQKWPPGCCGWPAYSCSVWYTTSPRYVAHVSTQWKDGWGKIRRNWEFIFTS